MALDTIDDFRDDQRPDRVELPRFLRDTATMRLSIAILTIAALLVCSESWSIDFHIDAGHDHGELIEGAPGDAHDHSGEACGHGHCHHSAVLAMVQAWPVVTQVGQVPRISRLAPPVIASRLYRPPIA